MKEFSPQWPKTQNYFAKSNERTKRRHRAFRRISSGLTLLSALFCLFGTFGTTGCSKPKLIPGTRIPDTRKNREIIKVVEKYRRALMNKEIGTLMSMAHPHYYEHSGSHKGEHHYGYKGLQKVLKKRLEQLRAVRYNIKYRKINWISENKVEVEIYIDASFQLAAGDDTDKWSRFTQHNKIVLTKENDRWLILRGM